jgi:uncharacterized protein
MLYNVASLLQEPTGASREYAVDGDVAIDGQPQRLRGRVRLDRTPRGVLVRASLHGSLETECSRCLRPCTLAVDLSIAEVFVPLTDLTSGTRIETQEGEEDSYRINDRSELDLTEAAQHYWAMTVPMAPVCREDCAGLCPSCGNERGASHTCSEAPADDRWSKLAELHDA